MLGWLLKKFRGESADNSKTLEVIPVSDTKALHVVERGSRILLIEVEGETSQVISQVSDPNLVNYLKSAKGSLKGSAFLAQYLKRAAVDEVGATPAAETPVTAKVAESRPRFDVTVDDASPTTPVVAAPSEPVPAKPEIKPVRSEAQTMALQQLEKAMDRFPDNTGTGGGSSDLLPSTVKISEPVTHALRDVVERQRDRITAIKEVQRREEVEKERVEGLLRRKKEVEEKIGQIQEMLARIDQDSSRNQPAVETSLLAASRELQQLESELSKIMTDPGVIKYLLQEREDFAGDERNPLDSIVNSVRTIERQRKQIAAIRHTREQAEAERRRVVVLLIRKNELETAIDEIKQVLKQIEETNAEIMRLDPYAMPETVPIVAMNELRRLEFELNTILADAGVAKKLAEAPHDEEGPSAPGSDSGDADADSTSLSAFEPTR